MKDNVIKYYQQKMSIIDSSSIYYLKYCEIYCIFYIKPYTFILTIHNKEILLNYSLSKLTENLPKFFLSCNKSTIVNILHVRSLYKKNNSYYILLYNEKKYKVSRRKVQMMKEMLIQAGNNIQICDSCVFIEARPNL